MRRPVLILLAVCVLAALVFGCGSGGGTESTEIADIQKVLPRPSHLLNKSELIQFSRKVCANITREINSGYERFVSEHDIEPGERPTRAEIKEIGEEFPLPLMHKQDREMINAGKDQSAADALKIFELGEKEVEEGWNHPAVAATDPGKVWVKTNPMLKSYGFTTCVRDEPLVE